jgi:phage shock protein E
MSFQNIATRRIFDTITKFRSSSAVERPPVKRLVVGSIPTSGALFSALFSTIIFDTPNKVRTCGMILGMGNESVQKTNKVYIIGSIIIAVILIFLGVNASKCHGDTCNSSKSDTANVLNSYITDEYQVFPKMVPEIISKQVANDEIVLLDVREDSEWYGGHIVGARHIALGNINSETTKELSKDLPIYVYCRSGKRAGEGEIKLQALGFKKAENIGGINYWQERGGNLIK